MLPCVFPSRAQYVITYRIGDAGQTLVLTESVLNHLASNRQATGTRREAGGQLFARFEGNMVRVEQATGPRWSDIRRRFTFVPNRFAERREIKRLFRVGLHYVGDWHTHPEAIPKPSCTDVVNCQDMFRKSKHELASFVMIVVGTELPPRGLFVSACDCRGVYELFPVANPGTGWEGKAKAK